MKTIFYKILYKGNAVIYVGVTTRRITQRFKEHLRCKRLNIEDFSVIEFHEIEHPKICSLEIFYQEREKVAELEKQYIKEEISKGSTLLNISDGGEWGTQILNKLRKEEFLKKYGSYEGYRKYRKRNEKLKKWVWHWIGHRSSNKVKVWIQCWMYNKNNSQVKVWLCSWVYTKRNNKTKVWLRTWINSNKGKLKTWLYHWIDGRTDSRTKKWLRNWVNHKSESKIKVWLRNWSYGKSKNRTKAWIANWVNHKGTSRIKVWLRNWVNHRKDY